MLTAIYDGNCIVCQSSCAALRALDWRGRIDFVDLHEGGAARHGELSYEQLMGEIHALDEQGQLYSGFGATRRLLREVPLGLPLWLLLQLPGMSIIGQRVYRFVARRRYRINRFFGVSMPDCANENCNLPH